MESYLWSMKKEIWMKGPVPPSNIQTRFNGNMCMLTYNRIKVMLFGVIDTPASQSHSVLSFDFKTKNWQNWSPIPSTYNFVIFGCTQMVEKSFQK